MAGFLVAGHICRLPCELLFPTQQAILSCITIFLRIDTAAFICFVRHFGVPTIQGLRLLLGQYDCATYTASLTSSLWKCVDKLVKVCPIPL